VLIPQLVRPEITGWAQINGGNLITTEEKGALDDWYVHSACSGSTCASRSTR
jgi:lipopolysaccharide/colanic/teichoic acid biosynthesis glycosyltransferase